MTFWKTIRTWLRQKIRPKFTTTFVYEDLPDKLEQKVLYVVLEDDIQWSVAMVCPCGCGEILHMNLLPDERPVWNVIHQKDNSSTLSPSIHRKKGCCSHFWYREGKVYWTADQQNQIQKDLILLLR